MTLISPLAHLVQTYKAVLALVGVSNSPGLLCISCQYARSDVQSYSAKKTVKWMTRYTLGEMDQCSE